MKTIVQRTLGGEFLAAFTSTKQASESTGVPKSTLRHTINGRKNKKFTFVEQNRKSLHNVARGVKRVSQREDDVVVAVYADVTTAAKAMNIAPYKLRRLLNSDKTLDGYTFNG